MYYINMLYSYIVKQGSDDMYYIYVYITEGESNNIQYCIN